MDVLDVVLGSLSFNPFCLMNQFLISNSRGSTGASSNGIHDLFLICCFLAVVLFFFISIVENLLFFFIRELGGFSRQ